MPFEIHRRLREETRPEHERLESRVEILRRVTTPDSRRALVASFWRLHGEIEAAVAPWLADVAGLDFERRRRTPLLRRDLAALDAEPPPLADLPYVTNAAEALGRLYVLEGSSLGGQVIRRQLAAEGMGFSGLSFLDPYGPQTGAMWRSFLGVVAAHTHEPQAADACIAGARAGFRLAELRLCEAPALQPG